MERKQSQNGSKEGKSEKNISYLNIHDDELWSDEESDYILKVSSESKRPELAEPKINYSSKIHSGHAKVSREEKDILYVPPKIENFSIPLPYVTPHAVESLGLNAIQALWKEFIDHGTDESELIETYHIPEIIESMESYGFHVPLKSVRFTYGENEFIDFKYVVDELTSLLNRPGVYQNPPKTKILLPPCCINGACTYHQKLTAEEREEMNISFNIEQSFLNYKSMKNGNVRIKHIPDILRDCNIVINTSLLADSWWINHGDFFIDSFSALERVTNAIRVDIEPPDDERYPVPKWMLNEFSPLEMKMFRHHFAMIDADGSGTVDAAEMVELVSGLGTRISLQQAQDLIDQYDLDKSGTIDFVEFMNLIFKIQQGTIDMENGDVGQALMESKYQLGIYDEIENIKANLPEYVRVRSYGGNPVVCDYIISGPASSLYEGGDFIFRVQYSAGYPYKMPECCFATRIFCLNVVTQISGLGGLPHLKYFWESSWNTRQLLQHVIFLLLNPDVSLLSPHMTTVINSFLKENFEIDENDCDSLVKSELADETMSVTTYSGSMHEKDTFREHLSKLPRLDQMHLNIAALFLTNKEVYDNLARQYVELYAKPIVLESY